MTGRLEQAFHLRQSDIVVEFVGRVERVLSDDDDGSRHQRFITRLRSGMTVLILHNIDLADRVPLEEGDRVRVRGEYEWNVRGGSIHWTHEDPRGWHEAGFVIHNGTMYGTLIHTGRERHPDSNHDHDHDRDADRN